MDFARTARRAAISRALFAGLMYAFSQFVVYIPYFVAFEAAHLHIYAYVCVHIHVYVCIHTCVCVCVCLYVCMYVCAHSACFI